MAAGGQAGHKKVAPALQSHRSGSGLHVLMGTGAKGLGSSTTLWKTAQGLVSGGDGTQQSLRYLPGLMLMSPMSSSCYVLPRTVRGLWDAHDH